MCPAGAQRRHPLAARRAAAATDDTYKNRITLCGALLPLPLQASSGTIPYPHDLLRQVASLVASLPALDGPAFQKDFLTEYNDTLLTIYLTTITKGILQVRGAALPGIAISVPIETSF